MPALPHIENVNRGLFPNLRKDMKMNFFLAIDPPTATAQEKQVRIIHGKPVFYDPAPVKSAKNLLIAQLLQHRPKFPYGKGTDTENGV